MTQQKTKFEKEDVIEIPYGFHTKPNVGDTQFLINKSDVLAVFEGMKELIHQKKLKNEIELRVNGEAQLFELLDFAVKDLKEND